MDTHQSFAYAWENDGVTYGPPVHGLLASQSQIPPASSVFQPSYEMPFAPDSTNEVQLRNDVSIGNNEVEPQPAQVRHEVQPDARFPSRGRGERLDWNGHKDMIKKLYVDQNKSLPETMEAMKERYSFDAS